MATGRSYLKVEELLHSTDDPENYHMHIRAIIQFNSDGQQYLKSFLKLYMIKRVQGVIESSSSASGCALAFVDLRQQLGNRVE